MKARRSSANHCMQSRLHKQSCLGIILKPEVATYATAAGVRGHDLILRPLDDAIEMPPGTGLFKPSSRHLFTQLFPRSKSVLAKAVLEFPLTSGNILQRGLRNLNHIRSFEEVTDKFCTSLVKSHPLGDHRLNSCTWEGHFCMYLRFPGRTRASSQWRRRKSLCPREREAPWFSVARVWLLKRMRGVQEAGT